jgi:hypothetical protein
MSEFIKIFDTFIDYWHIAPKNWDDLDRFILECLREKKDDLAEYLADWKTAMHYQMEKEWDAMPLHGPYGPEGYCYCGEFKCEAMANRISW